VEEVSLAAPLAVWSVVSKVAEGTSLVPSAFV
jgi:hypothetical protein